MKHLDDIEKKLDDIRYEMSRIVSSIIQLTKVLEENLGPLLEENLGPSE